jgi:DNA mismatch repair protein MSH2
VQVVGVAATFCEVWEAACSLLGELDVLVAFADLSTAAPKPYVRPTMLPSSGESLFASSSSL